MTEVTLDRMKGTEKAYDYAVIAEKGNLRLGAKFVAYGQATLSFGPMHFIGFRFRAAPPEGEEVASPEVFQHAFDVEFDKLSPERASLLYGIIVPERKVELHRIDTTLAESGLFRKTVEWLESNVPELLFHGEQLGRILAQLVEEWKRPECTEAPELPAIVKALATVPGPIRKLVPLLAQEDMKAAGVDPGESPQGSGLLEN